MYDAAVVGLGAMGSAALYSLAKRDLSVVGIEQYELGHELGSSHGHTRIIRSVYNEGGIYLPLVKYAYREWERIEAESGCTFFHRTGGLDISETNGGILESALKVAKASGFEHELLDGQEIEQRFPAFEFRKSVNAVYAPDSGVLESDNASSWMRDQAVKKGAVTKSNTVVTGWRLIGGGYELTTTTGVIKTRKIIISAGAWVTKLVPSLRAYLLPERQVVGWLEPDISHTQLPVFVYETSSKGRYYCQPPIGEKGLKIGLLNHRGQRGEAYIQNIGVESEDEGLLNDGVQRCLKVAPRKFTNLSECRFTMSPDGHFFIDALAGNPDLILLSPCSGHGYKFSPAIGELAALMVSEQALPVDVGPFALNRALKPFNVTAS